MFSKKIEHSLNQGLHEVERNLRCIAHHGAVKKIQPKLYPTSTDFQKVEHLKKKPFYNHPLNIIATMLDAKLIKEDFSQIKTYIFKKK